MRMTGIPSKAPDTPRKWSSVSLNVIERKHARKIINVLLVFFNHFLFVVLLGMHLKR